MTGDTLTDVEREMLDFEGIWWKQQGAKEDEIRRRFDVTATRYYQRLIALVRRDDALAYAPVTVKRLRRLYGEGRRAG